MNFETKIIFNGWKFDFVVIFNGCESDDVERKLSLTDEDFDDVKWKLILTDEISMTSNENYF